MTLEVAAWLIARADLFTNFDVTANCACFSPDSFPVLGVDSEHGGYPRCQIGEATVIADFAIAEQPGE